MDEGFYYSLDKLVEFGFGASVASQMINNMNQSISAMSVPGAGKPTAHNAEAIYYVAKEKKAEGPFSAIELARMIQNGDVAKETYIWQPGMSKWDLAQNLPDVLRLVAITPPAI